MKKKILIILGIAAVLGFIGLAIGLKMYFKKTKDFATADADFKVTAKQIFDEYSKDENTSNAKYVVKDKTIEISGTIQTVTDNSDSTKTIVLSVGSPDGDVSCTLTKEESTKAKVTANSAVVLKGQCTGLQELISKEVIMIRCAVVQ